MDIIELLERNYNTITKSYNTLKIILEPNLTDEKKKLMNFLLELLISQIKLFVDLNSITNLEKIYQILNLNNQVLSKRISCFFYLNDKNDNFFNSESIIEDSKNSRNTKLDSLNIISSNDINIKRNIMPNYFSNNKETIFKTNNTIYDVDEDNFTASEKNKISDYKNPNKNSDLIKTNQKKLDSKNKNSYNINNSNSNSNSNSNRNSKKLNTYNNKYEDKKKDLPYNLNINIYSNNSNNNLRNLTEENYSNYYSINNKYYNTNTKNKNLNDNLINKQSNEKRKIDKNSSKNKNQVVPKTMEAYIKNIRKENELYKERKNNIKNFKTNISLKTFEVSNSSKNKLKKNNTGLKRICENNINSYREFDKKFKNYYKKRKSNSHTKYCFKKASIPKKKIKRIKFSSSCPRRKFIFLEKNKSNELNGNLSSPNLSNKNNKNIK